MRKVNSFFVSLQLRKEGRVGGGGGGVNLCVASTVPEI